ncbi:MAG: proprotein convertase P-domain-containing protein [Deltaproteobacteria bacterium]|nr:proprotein convertase P-domain-containing protein [Deltaproteobacteria bacterium]
MTRFSSLLTLWMLGSAVAVSGCDSETGSGGDGDAPLSDYDALFDGAPGNDALPFDIKADGPAPRQFDLVDVQSPVKSQGRRGVCSVFSTTALMEHLYILAGQEDPDFSEQYLQWSVKEEVGSFPRTSGSNANYNLQAINEYGIPIESAWAYEIDQWDENDDPECAKDNGDDRPTRCYTNGAPPQEALDAEKFTLPRGRYRNSRRNSIIDHMRVTGTGAVVGLDFFYQAWNHRGTSLTRTTDNWDKGIVLDPNAEDITKSHEKRAGHSVLLVGWDLDMSVPRREADGSVMTDANGEPVMDTGFFVFKNSWGTGSFGVDNPHGAGYGFISMEYVETYGSVRVSDIPEVELPEPEEPGIEEPTDPEAEIFDSEEVVEIPDNDPVGVTSNIEVPSEGVVSRITVEFQIEHTYRGDLTVRLVHGDTIVTLHDRAGGGEDDLVKTLELTDFADQDRGGTWQLQVADNANLDTGRINGWTLLIE